MECPNIIPDCETLRPDSVREAHQSPSKRLKSGGPLSLSQYQCSYYPQVIHRLSTGYPQVGYPQVIHRLSTHYTCNRSVLRPLRAACVPRPVTNTSIRPNRAFVQWDANARTTRGSAPELRAVCFLGLRSDSTPQEMAAALATTASVLSLKEPRQRRFSPLM